MSMPAPDLDVDRIVELLATGADHPLSPGVPVSQLDHALQTAALLAHLHPGDDELVAAGLVHDMGHLLPDGTDETHATDVAAAVRQALGERVAGTVGLHVAAKRYLVATESGYGGVLTADSVVSLGRQGGAMTEDEAATFLARPWGKHAPACDAAPGRRQREGRRSGGRRPGGLGTPPPGRLPAGCGEEGLTQPDVGSGQSQLRGDPGVRPL